MLVWILVHFANRQRFLLHPCLLERKNLAERQRQRQFRQNLFSKAKHTLLGRLPWVVHEVDNLQPIGSYVVVLEVSYEYS